jgi:hypothetical protein
MTDHPRLETLTLIDAATGEQEHCSSTSVEAPWRPNGCDFCGLGKQDGVALVEERNGHRVCSSCIRRMRAMGAMTCPVCRELGSHAPGCTRGQQR